MKQFAVVQHTYSEFLGLIEKQLEKRDIGFAYLRPFVGQHLPGSPLQFDALFLLAGGLPTADREEQPWLEDELALIPAFQKAERPVAGIGMGALLVAEAAGGTAHMEPRYVAKWATARKTAAGEGDALAEAMHGRELLVMHNGSVTLPDDMQPILEDEDGQWLAIRPDPLTYGLLFRPEAKPGMIEDIIMEHGREHPDNIGEILTQAREKWDDMQRTTDLVLRALTDELDLMKERRKAPVFNLKIES